MKYLTIALFPLLMAFQLEECSSNSQSTSNAVTETSQEELVGLEKAYFASGCFWCVEAVFESVKGVKEAVSGYSGGSEPNPTYYEVGGGKTSHAEAVEVYYDPAVIDYKTLVKVYYGSHNPVTVNGQAPDFGRQYRSMIYYQNDQEKSIANAFKDSLDQSGAYDQPIATEIVKLKKFWKAEDYHQDYEKKNPNNSYVRNVSVPRLKRFQAKYPELLKENH